MDFQVIIIGGSYAGLSAAMSLGRSRRKVLVIDSGTPCNRQTPHSHNFLTRDGETPAHLSSIAKTQVQQYPSVSFLDDFALEGRILDHGFEIKTQNGKTFTANKLVFASGIKDIMPNIKGFSDCWGITVVHCPYCHGYEIRDQKTAIMCHGEGAMHLASLVRNLTDNLTILTSGASEFTSEQKAKLDRNNIQVNATPLAEILHENGQVRSLVFEDGRKEDFEAVYAPLSFAQSSDIPVLLGCERTDDGYLLIDHLHNTTVAGVYACGDNANRMRSVANAVAAGNLTGAAVNMALTAETF